MENLHHKAPNLNPFRDAEETPFPINSFRLNVAKMTLFQDNKKVARMWGSYKARKLSQASLIFKSCRRFEELTSLIKYLPQGLMC